MKNTLLLHLEIGKLCGMFLIDKFFNRLQLCCQCCVKRLHVRSSVLN